MASARTPRIAYVTSSRTVGGAEKLITALLAEGRERGWEQLVLNPFADPMAAALFEAEWKDARYVAGECSSMLQAPRLRRWMIRQIEQFRPDIIHVTLFHAAVLMGTVPRRGEKRILTHAYGEGLAQLSNPRLRKALDRWAGRKFDHVSAISESVRRFLTEEQGYPPPPVGKIVLGWQGRAPSKPDRGDRPPTIICVAVLRKEKGHDTLLAAFAKVKREIADARLVLVGGGPWREGVEALVAASGVSDSVTMVGRVPDIWPYLADADLFALASPMEALGIAVMEAMAVGLPSVVSNVGGLPEFVEEGVTGELFEPGNSDELAAKLVALLRDPARMERMSRAALAAAPPLHMDASVANYFNLYHGLLGQRQSMGQE